MNNTQKCLREPIYIYYKNNLSEEKKLTIFKYSLNTKKIKKLLFIYYLYCVLLGVVGLKR